MSDLSASLLAVLERGTKADRLGKLIQEALVLVQTVLSDLGEEAVAISFNGGKDCTVLLHIYAAVLYANHVADIPSHLRPLASKDINVPSAPPPVVSHDQPISPSPSLSAPATAPPPLPSPTPSTPNPHPHATHRHPQSDSASLPYPPIRSIYITAPNPFPTLDEFVLDITKRYAMDLYRFGGGMKAALEEYLGCGGGKGVKGVLVGTRQGDPNGEVPILAYTDPSWPQFLRIHPILHWTYADVWDFLLELHVPYCTLYDEGYTSLGSTTNTSPNPLLRNPSSESGWDPAYKLQDASQERAGRH
ncbi:hypothetical protein CI109_107333 [Kwoniella shandongensis]|uniref:FAD synthase n=1 Tax=Kwoniella shandongensis TaxID=1734106 RepID=A0A5M6BYJ5_9TREE|nr:uncharacterized protein CI109_004739 [Kwoniella shandongensis]KAA5526962.1 hypothetical protein CI109_004739 [Kwoniella shandongensis]